MADSEDVCRCHQIMSVCVIPRRYICTRVYIRVCISPLLCRVYVTTGKRRNVRKCFARRHRHRHRAFSPYVGDIFIMLVLQTDCHVASCLHNVDMMESANMKMGGTPFGKFTSSEFDRFHSWKNSMVACEIHSYPLNRMNVLSISTLRLSISIGILHSFLKLIV